MRVWKCKCSTELFFKYGRDEKLVMKICPVCNGLMEAKDNERLE